MRSGIAGAILVALLLIPPGGASGAPEAERERMEARLEAYAERVRLAMTLATVGAFSPLLENVHLHAQQLVNLLEGSRGRHFVRTLSAINDDPGLVNELDSLTAALRRMAEVSPLREPIIVAAGNIRAYLHMALDAALSALTQRRQDRAVADMMRAFAYLSAALGRETDPAYVPGLLTIRRLVAGGR